jgi:hypothetical protein
VISSVLTGSDAIPPQATILQGDAEQPVRYVEIPRKAANAEEWIASQAPALAMRASTCIHHLEVANCDKMV